MVYPKRWGRRKKTYTFSYGHVIYLYLDTEGLNGDKVIVDVIKLLKVAVELKMID